MKKKQKKLKPHANQRLHERCNFAEYNLTPSEIAEKINKNTITFIKKLTNSRSLGYVSINGCNFKVIYSKTTGNVVTFLPITHNYEFIYDMEFENKKYRLTIYPDCYHETKNSRVMTKFQICVVDLLLGKSEWIDLETKGAAFEWLFDFVWTRYLETRREEK